MTSTIVKFFLITIAVIFDVADSQSVLFPNNGQYVYSFTGTVSAGCILPNSLSSSHSLKGLLKIQKTTYSTDHIIKLANLKHTLFNSQSQESAYKNIDAAALPLELPFLVNIRQEGTIGSLNFTDDDPLWSMNIKRGIAANLQMQTTGRPLPGAFKLSEPCLHGTCIVEYSSSDGLTIRKSNSVPTLVPSPSHDLWMSVMPNICTKNTKNPLIGNADRWYTMDHRGLVHLASEGNIEVHYHNHIFQSITNITLERLYITNEQLTSKDTYSKQAGLAFQPPERHEPTGQRAPLTAAGQLEQLWKILGQIADGLEQPGLTDTLLKDKLPLRLQEITSTMSYETLSKTYDELELGTSYKRETMKNIFLEVLPQVKSKAAVLLVRDLVVKRKIFDEFTSLQLLRKIPFNAADLNQDLLTEMEPLLKLSQDHSRDVRHAAILSFSTLVFKTFISGACTTDTFEDYVQTFFSRFTESPDYADRLVWLSGLSNLQLEHVTSYLAPVISGTLGHSTNERFLAVWATMALAHLYPTEVHNIYWPILHNPSEPLEMRIAAITMLLLSESTPHRLMSLHWYISTQNDPHLKNFFYTTVKSLERTTFDCYKHMAKTTSYLGKIVKQPENHKELWATGNYLLDIADESRDMGFMLQTFTIGNQLTGLPEILYFTLITQNAGLVVQDYAVYLKLQGVVSNFLIKLHSMNIDTIHMHQLEAALKQLKVQTHPIQPVHVELLVKHQQKIIYALHLNQTTFNKWTEIDIKKTIDNILQAESHVNQQFLVYPTILKSTLPSELGTPIITDTMLSSLTSIRGNLTFSMKNEEIARKNDVHFRTSTLALISLSAYNPIADVHHIGEVAQVSDAYFPANFTAAVSVINRNFRMTWKDPKSGQLPGFLAYSGSKVSTVSQKGVPFEDFCPSCPIEMVNTVNKTFNLGITSSFLGLHMDCNGHVSASELFWQILSSHKSNANSIPFAKPVLVLLHGLVLAAIPAKGPCVVSATASNPEMHKRTDLELDFFTTSNASEKVHVKLGLLTRMDDEQKRVVSSFNTSSIIEWDEYKYKVVMKAVGRQSPKSDEWKVCLESEEHYMKDEHLENISLNSRLLSSQILLAVGTSPGKCPLNDTVIAVNINSHESPASNEMFDFQLKVKNIPDHVSSVFSKYNSALDIIGPKSDIFEYKVSKIILNELSKQNAFINGTIATDNKQTDLSFMNQYSGVATTLKNDDYSILFNPTGQFNFFKEIGLLKECRIKPDKIVNVNKKDIELSMTKTCELLAIGECTTHPQFAILRLPSPNGLAIRFFIGDNYADIQPTKPNITASINGQQVQHQPSYQYPESENFYDFKISGSANRLKIESKISVLKIVYQREEALVLMPSIHVPISCGACLQDETLHTKC